MSSGGRTHESFFLVINHDVMGGVVRRGLSRARIEPPRHQAHPARAPARALPVRVLTIWYLVSGPPLTALPPAPPATPHVGQPAATACDYIQGSVERGPRGRGGWGCQRKPCLCSAQCTRVLQRARHATHVAAQLSSAVKSPQGPSAHARKCRVLNSIELSPGEALGGGGHEQAAVNLG